MSRAPSRDEVSVLIPAAGTGERLGLGPKATLPLAGRPVIDWLVDKAARVGAEVIVACAPGVPAPAETVRIEGGTTREESVARLAHVATRPWCLLWDAASPFASVALARSVLAAAQAGGAATPCLAGQVRWFVLEDGQVAQAHPGSHAGISQTPQAYRTALLRQVTQRGAVEGWAAQSTVELFLRTGLPVAAVPGEKLNLKLTTPDDWVLAEALHAQLSR